MLLKTDIPLFWLKKKLLKEFLKAGYIKLETQTKYLLKCLKDHNFKLSQITLWKEHETRTLKLWNALIWLIYVTVPILCSIYIRMVYFFFFGAYDGVVKADYFLTQILDLCQAYRWWISLYCTSNTPLRKV